MRHKRSHLGIKPYKCNHPGCDKQYSRGKALNEHQFVHTGIYLYKCDLCGESFRYKANFDAHKLVHNQMKIREE